MPYLYNHNHFVVDTPNYPSYWEPIKLTNRIMVDNLNRQYYLEPTKIQEMGLQLRSPITSWFCMHVHEEPHIPHAQIELGTTIVWLTIPLTSSHVILCRACTGAKASKAWVKSAVHVLKGPCLSHFPDLISCQIKHLRKSIEDDHCPRP